MAPGAHQAGRTGAEREVKQVVQSLSGGRVRVLDVPRPTIGPTEVLVQTAASVLSPGTERAVTGIAQSNLLSKARARPDLVRQVVARARADGIVDTARKVRTRLGGDIPLGYSAAGIAIEIGEHVEGLIPGQLVATGGAGKANHAEFQSVPGLLCCPVPEGVTAEEAAFATIASIALHALRLAEVSPGARLVVVGLGLVGQLGVRLALAAGLSVAAIDVVDAHVARARGAGALGLVEAGDQTTESVLSWSRGRGADAVLLTASGPSSAVIARTPALCRDRASVVVVGDIGLELDRAPFYDKELVLRFARSYGPGRYDRSYEDWGVDFPVGYVRWTEGRNIEAVLDLMASDRLSVANLITHRLPIGDASRAYELLESNAESYAGIVLTFDHDPAPDEPIRLKLRPSSAASTPGIGLIGAGAFASSVLIPSFRAVGLDHFVSVASAAGLSSRRLAETAGFKKAVSGASAVIDDPDVEVVVIATPHLEHGRLVAAALRAGKHVFCEKPLAVTIDELEEVEAAWRQSGKILFVGFNRRYSPAVTLGRDHFAGGSGPIVITYRVSAGPIPAGHWYEDRRQGGRLVGEVCHFIDTCGALVGEEPSAVTSASSNRPGGSAADGYIVSLQYPSGSLATISYASGGHTRTGKERIEAHGRQHSVVIEDFLACTADGRRTDLRHDRKGYGAQAAAFSAALRGDYCPVAVIASSRAAIHAAATLPPAAP